MGITGVSSENDLNICHYPISVNTVVSTTCGMMVGLLNPINMKHCIGDWGHMNHWIGATLFYQCGDDTLLLCTLQTFFTVNILSELK